MKKIFFLFFFISVYNFLFAQQSIDSLQKILNAHTQDDTLKVIQLNELARICFFNLQYEKGFTAIYEARELTEKLRYEKGEGLHFLTMAILHANTGLFMYYDRKASWSHLDVNEKEEALKFEIAEQNNGLIEKGNTRRFEALKFFEEHQNKEAAAHMLYIISTFYLFNDKATEALDYLDQALKLFAEIKEDALSVFVLTSKMYALHLVGKIKESNEADSSATKIISGISNVRESSLLVNYMCRFYFHMGNKMLTIEKELKTENILEQAGDKEMRIIIIEDLAVFFGYLSMSQKSVEYYKKSIYIREQINYYDDAVRIYFNLGFELVGLKQFEEANKYFLKAKDLAAK